MMFILIVRAGVLAGLSWSAGRKIWCRISSPSCPAALAVPSGFSCLSSSSWDFSSSGSRSPTSPCRFSLPIFIAANVDMVWLATLICVNLQTSFLHAAIRLGAVLPARCCATRGHDRRHLSRHRALRRDAAHRARAVLLLSGARVVAAEDYRLVNELVARRRRRFFSGYGRSSARRAHPPPRPSIRRRPCRPSRIAAWL